MDREPVMAAAAPFEEDADAAEAVLDAEEEPVDEPEVVVVEEPECEPVEEDE